MKTEIIDKLADLITTAFGLVAALAWNSAIQGVFKKFFGTAKGLIPMMLYVLIVTIIAVALTIWIGKVKERTKKL
jgi:hypothetical protein